MPIITFNDNALPITSTYHLNGSDLVVRTNAPKNFPHITFHAGGATHYMNQYVLTYLGIPKYHFVLNLGMYIGRQYVGGAWQDDPYITNTNFPSYVALANSLALDIEPVLVVT